MTKQLWFVFSQDRLTHTARRFTADNSGATAIEYALMTFIILGVLIAMGQFTGALNGMFAQLTTFFNG
jgi:Flp pilus assembly pilin Flp